MVFVLHAFASSPEDLLLPFMSDVRWAPDTLFLVAEEDWRLWRGDCHRGAGTRPEDLPEDRQGELSDPSSDAACFQPAEAPPSGVGACSQTLKPRREKPETRRGGPAGWGRGKKATAKEVEETSQELCDIIHMVNMAHREARGDLVWLSYTVSKTTKWTPTHGSTLIAVSARGARILNDNKDQWFKEPWHWDLVLKGLLQKLSAAGEQSVLPSCYVFPSLGGFDDHISAFQNTKSPEVRECWWEMYGARQEGTRELDGEGRAFSRLNTWKNYELREWPPEQADPHKNMKVVLEIQTLPLDTPDIWWTAAASIHPDFYKRPEELLRAKGEKKRNKNPLSLQPRRRSNSPTQQKPWRWQDTFSASSQPLVGLDSDDRFGEIKLTFEQTWSPSECSDFTTSSSARRRKGIEQYFKRRYFTNDPDKARWNISHELSAMPPVMRLCLFFRSFFALHERIEDFSGYINAPSLQ